MSRTGPRLLATAIAWVGAVVAGVLGAWASSLIGSTGQPPTPTPNGPTASGERAVATQDNSGIIVTGDNGTVRR